MSTSQYIRSRVHEAYFAGRAASAHSRQRAMAGVSAGAVLGGAALGAVAGAAGPPNRSVFDIGARHGYDIKKATREREYWVNGVLYRDPYFNIGGKSVPASELFKEKEVKIRDLSEIPIIPPGLGKALWWLGFAMVALWNLITYGPLLLEVLK